MPLLLAAASQQSPASTTTSTTAPPAAVPLTGYETHGGLTTEAEETALWSTIASETALTVETAGVSLEGRPIRRVSIGSGTARTMLIVCCRHGYEKAQREGALALMRNLAYSTEPSVTSYLTQNRVVLIPVLAVDYFAEGIEAPKGGGGFSSWLMSAPESKTFGEVWADTQPIIHLDAHAFGNPADPPLTTQESFGAWPASTILNGHPDIRSLVINNGPGSAMINAVAAAGFTTASYTSAGTSAALAAPSGVLNHAVSFTSETNTAHSRAWQYESMLAALNALVAWHDTNGAAAVAAQAASKASPLDPSFVPSYWSIAGPLVEVPGLLGYTIPAPLNPWKKLWLGIEDPVDNFVPIAQAAGRAIPQLLDLDSPHRAYPSGVVRVME